MGGHTVAHLFFHFRLHSPIHPLQHPNQNDETTTNRPPLRFLMTYEILLYVHGGYLPHPSITVITIITFGVETRKTSKSHFQPPPQQLILWHNNGILISARIYSPSLSHFLFSSTISLHRLINSRNYWRVETSINFLVYWIDYRHWFARHSSAPYYYRYDYYHRFIINMKLFTAGGRPFSFSNSPFFCPLNRNRKKLSGCIFSSANL